MIEREVRDEKDAEEYEAREGLSLVAVVKRGDKKVAIYHEDFRVKWRKARSIEEKLDVIARYLNLI